MLIPGNLNFHISRRQEDAKKNMKKMVPSCSDLLNMWHQMNRMTSHSLATNEIPVVPRNFLGLLMGITHTYPESHQSRSQFRKQTNRQNTFEEDVLSPFVKSSQEPNLLLKVGFSDPVEPLYVDQRKFLHQPKNEPEKHGFQAASWHPLVEDQTFQAQHILPKSNTEKFSEESTKYERAFPLNEASETNNLFGSFSDPFSEGFSSFTDTHDFPEGVSPEVSRSGHHTEESRPHSDHHRKDSLFSGFRETAPEAHLRDDVMDMFGTVLHDTEEEQRWIQEGKQPTLFDPLPQWMVAGDLGSFGSFASDNEPSDDLEATDSVTEFEKAGRFNTPRGDSQGVHFQQPFFLHPDERVHRQESCIEKRDRLCDSDLNCACTGWMTLKCVGERCRQQDAFEVPEGFNLGTWHEGPLSFSELGMNRGRRVMRNPWTPM